MSISIRLGAELETRLNALVQITGRTKTYYIKEAIEEKLNDLEDFYIAEQRLEKRGKTLSMQEVEQSLDLSD